MTISRREFVSRAGVMAAVATVGAADRAARAPAAKGAAASDAGASSDGRGLASLGRPGGARYRVISVNDYAGDADSLYQLVHHVLSPSVDVRAIVASHLSPHDPLRSSKTTADDGVKKAQEVVRLMRLGRRIAVRAGANRPVVNATTPQVSPGARLIIKEALRTDTRLPLVVTLGGALTDLASAYLMEPRIAERLTAVWVGGPEYPNAGPAPDVTGEGGGLEPNLEKDLIAAQIVFDSGIPMWQVPRNAYRQCLLSLAQLALNVAPSGALGAYLYDAVRNTRPPATADVNLGETHIMRGSALVLLTALQSSHHPSTSSSAYVSIPAPRINRDGTYTMRSSVRAIRVYGHLDLRLMFDDFFAKLALNCR